MNKKVIAVLIIIGIAILLLVFGAKKDIESPLPTRDLEGVEVYTNAEDACAEITLAQEFDDPVRASEFFETCVLDFNQ